MRKRTKKEIIKLRKDNARLYPAYKMLSWDLVFYYAISYIFLTVTKKFSIADIMLVNALYTIFKIIFQVPCNYLVEKINKKKSLVIGNICVSMYILLLINANNFNVLIIANIFCAIGFVLKDLSASNLLYTSLSHRNGKGMYSKIEEKGSEYYYFFDGITSMLTGFLFLANEYLPMYICLAFTILGVIVSLFFRDVEDVYIKENTNYFRDLGKSLDFIIHSKRLRALTLYGIVMWGLIYVFITVRRGILSEIGITAEYFAMIFSSLTIISAISVKCINKVKHKFGKKILSDMGLVYVLTIIFLCLAVNLVENSVLVILIVLLGYVISYFIEANFVILMEEYLKSFSTSKTITRVRAAYNILIALSQTILAILASVCLEITTSVNTMLVIGIIFLVIIIYAASYMKGKVGLKPEEYDKKDIDVLN